jgi:antitoxin CptB
VSAPHSTQGRLLWRARRGLLELDLLLRPFIERHPGGLPEEWRQPFEALLDYPDPVLLDLLMLRQPPHDIRLAPLIAAIREAAQTAPPPL